MSQNAAWFLLVASGLVDVAWAYATKRAAGFSNIGWGLLWLVLLALFIALLMRALTVLPLGIAYVVWTGIGAVGAMLVGITLLGEAADSIRLVFAAIIVFGICGLKLAG